MQTISALFDHHDNAVAAVKDLEAERIPSAGISIVANEAAHRGLMTSGSPSEGMATAAGASMGAAVAGGAGLLAGLGVMAIPGIGPVVAAGWLASTAAGAALGGVAGGFMGSLVESGHSVQDANRFAEGVKSGDTLVTVRVDDEYVARAQDILDRHGSIVDDPQTSDPAPIARLDGIIDDMHPAGGADRPYGSTDPDVTLTGIPKMIA